MVKDKANLPTTNFEKLIHLIRDKKHKKMVFERLTKGHLYSRDEIQHFLHNNSQDATHFKNYGKEIGLLEVGSKTGRKQEVMAFKIADDFAVELALLTVLKQILNREVKKPKTEDQLNELLSEQLPSRFRPLLIRASSMSKTSAHKPPRPETSSTPPPPKPDEPTWKDWRKDQKKKKGKKPDIDEVF